MQRKAFHSSSSRAAIVLVAALILALTVAPSFPHAPSGPVELTAEQDRQRALDLLGIESLRRGVNARDPDAPNAANWDEEKANPYPDLPDPLTCSDQELTLSRVRQVAFRSSGMATGAFQFLISTYFPVTF